ncbi:Gfo/Idh/MocA family protein [Cohnella sp. GbtcB17]|uniref:Gfo/Idh/MocA family protein n=1 Tax=Cohnella sp. GbtcB17 TaxID=2824762 RepID=UPI001C2FBC05|nr:Gfo/Idh/MocA family oxidoreductase [Cohnella sp. GbtcB17]
MLKVGLIGIGFIGRAHLDQYLRLEQEDYPIRVTAICDTDPKKFEGEFTEGNIGVGNAEYDFSKYRVYTNLDDMLASESFDYVDIALPTFLHDAVAIQVLKKGFNVLCEKPMALDSKRCKAMLEAAGRSGKHLMIGQCLRFWPAYEYLKDCVDKSAWGAVRSARFYRGSSAPVWSNQNWLLDESRSGGALVDFHVHDADMIRWLFGNPASVSALGRNVYPGSGYDILSAQYVYPDGKIVSAEADWSLPPSIPFEMSYRVGFDEAAVVFTGGKVTVYPKEGSAFTPELSADTGFYREIVYLADCLLNGRVPSVSQGDDVAASIRLVEAEKRSADGGGKWIKLK